MAAGPFGLGPFELVLIVVVVLLVFGATRVSDLMGSVGKGIKEFRKNVKDDEPETAVAEPPSSATATPGMIAAVKCPSCGSLNAATAKHCNECGAAVQAPVA